MKFKVKKYQEELVKAFVLFLLAIYIFLGYDGLIVEMGHMATNAKGKFFQAIFLIVDKIGGKYFIAFILLIPAIFFLMNARVDYAIGRLKTISPSKITLKRPKMTVNKTVKSTRKKDKKYEVCRDIKIGNKKLKGPLSELQKWFSYHYKVEPLSIIYSFIKGVDRPNLEIVFESKEGIELFLADEDKNLIIQNKFSELISGYKKYQSENLIVIHSYFNSIARLEANKMVEESEINELTNKIGSEKIWLIKRDWESIIVFFYTQEQQDSYKDSSLIDLIKEEYLKLVKPYDEFNYYNTTNLHIRLDNKDNFLDFYQGNWFYYYR